MDVFASTPAPRGVARNFHTQRLRNTKICSLLDFVGEIKWTLHQLVELIVRAFDVINVTRNFVCITGVVQQAVYQLVQPVL